MLDDVRAALKENTAVIGAERTLKLLREGKIKKIFLAANTANELKEDMKRYSAMVQVPIMELKLSNEQLGTLCKKQFSISVIGVRSE